MLTKALSIVKRNEHYRSDSYILCCESHECFPQDLFDKLNVLLNLVKTRNAPIRETLTFFPTALVNLVLDYVHVTVSDCSTSSTETVV